MVVSFITFVVQLWLKLELSVTSINWFSITFEAFQSFSIWNEKSCLFGPRFFFSKKKNFLEKSNVDTNTSNAGDGRWRTGGRSHGKKSPLLARSATIAFCRNRGRALSPTRCTGAERGSHRRWSQHHDERRRAKDVPKPKTPAEGSYVKTTERFTGTDTAADFSAAPRKSRRRNFRCSHFFLLLRGRKMIFARHRRRTARREAKSRWSMFRRCRLDKKTTELTVGSLTEVDKWKWINLMRKKEEKMNRRRKNERCQTNILKSSSDDNEDDRNMNLVVFFSQWRQSALINPHSTGSDFTELPILISKTPSSWKQWMRRMNSFIGTYRQTFIRPSYKQTFMNMLIKQLRLIIRSVTKGKLESTIPFDGWNVLKLLRIELLPHVA